MRFLAFITLFCLTFMGGHTVWAGATATDTIVAVVNDQVITKHQLVDRTRLNLRQLGLGDATAPQQESVMRRTLSGMIDEELQRQFAARAGIALSAAEIKRGEDAVAEAVGGVAAWKKLTQGLENTALDKMKAEILWEKISAQAVKPQVNVGLSEVDKLLEELAKSRHVVERQIAMIMIGNANDKEETKAQLQRITDIREKLQNGADFATLARTYSEDKTAAKGGEMGWFGTGELNPQLEAALDKMQPGQISEPIRTPVGWHLIKLENARTTKPIDTKPITQLKIYILAGNTQVSDTKQDDLVASLKKVSKKLDNTDDVSAFFDKKAYHPAFQDSQDLGWIAPTDLHPPFQDALKDTKVGTWSKPIAMDTKIGMLFVAGTRTVMPAGLDAYRNKVMENLFSNRLELATRRFMQELRQRAFLDIRQ